MTTAGMWSVPKAYFDGRTQYIGVSQNGDELSPDLLADEYKQDPFSHQAQAELRTDSEEEDQRSLLKTLVIQTFCLLWLLPVGLLLYLNFHVWILGASAWCPGGDCYPQIFNTATLIPQRLSAKFDRQNHNLLGGLQFVAKALEVWFILIASWLVYLLTMFLARRRSGLPIAYLARPTEFAELPAVFDPYLWKTLPHLRRKSGSKKAGKRVWIFVLFTVFLCIICNLMGPATAVLVLPSLQWIDQTGINVATLVGYNSAEPPSSDGKQLFSNSSVFCEQANYTLNQWGCSAIPFAAQMDGWVESYVASAGAVNGITSQGDVSFGFNSTFWVEADGSVTDFLSWAPSRQTVQGLSNDLTLVQFISQGHTYEELDKPGWNDEDWFNSFFPYNNTVMSTLYRNGPVAGVAANMWLGYNNETWWDSFLDEEQTSGIRCYNNYNISNTPLSRGALTGIYTKCVKWGELWDMNYQHGSFTIQGLWKSWLDDFGPFVLFDIWTSDQAAFFLNNQLPAGLSPDCLPVNQVIPSDLNCDWNAFFAITPDSVLATRSRNVNTIHLHTNYKPVDGHPSAMDLMFDYVAYLNFTTYSLDPSPLSNPMHQVFFPDLPTNGEPITVDPMWTLAAWSADNGGTIAPGRAAAVAVLDAFDRFWDTDMFTSNNPLYDYMPFSDFIALLPIIQTLSIVDQELDDTFTTPVDTDHPMIKTSGRVYVWAYGISSRTSWLGVVVACVGAVIVIFQSFLGLLDRRPYRSPTELLVAALEHAPGDEFRGISHDEVAVGKTFFRVQDAHIGYAASYKFSKVQ